MEGSYGDIIFVILFMSQEKILNGGVNMRYEGRIFRPPSEAYSLIIQVTIGCVHNKCTFCSMYKEKTFRLRNLQEIYEDLRMARDYYKVVKRIFLADGDALAISTKDLKNILIKIKEIFPECERVGIYGAPRDILRKSQEELKSLRELGIGILYLGVETGSIVILNDIKKGVTPIEMIEAGKKVKESGIKLSITLISGIGGRDRWVEHALESARVVSEINPDYLGLLTLIIEEETELKKMVERGEFIPLTPHEVMLETKLFLENVNLSNCVFRSNHASNYVSLKGVLKEDKEELIDTIKDILEKDNSYKSEYFRGL